MLGALLSFSVVRLLAAALTTAVATATLAALARRYGRGKWPTLTALASGVPESEPETPSQDLRFAAVVASIVSSLSWVIALDTRFRELSGATRAFALALGIPLVALVVATLADVLARDGPPGESDSEPEAEPEAGVTVSAPGAVDAVFEPTNETTTDRPEPLLDTATIRRAGKATPDELRALIDAARAELTQTLFRSADKEAHDALASFEEKLAEYGGLLDEPEADLSRIAQRVREAKALARAWEGDGSEALRTLGLTPEATLDDARRVFRELARIYHADAAGTGIDPDCFAEIALAYERVKRLRPEQARPAPHTPESAAAA